MSYHFNLDREDGDVKDWSLTYDKKDDLFFVYETNSGVIPTHEELRNIIQEFCNLYDAITVEAIEKHNRSRKKESDRQEYFNRCRRKTFLQEESESDFYKPKPSKPPLRVKPPLNGFVYLVQYGKSNFHKIGLSAKPHERLGQLQTSTPEKLSLIHTIETSNMVELEAYFHNRYSHNRSRGEWFELDERSISDFMNHSEGK